MAERYQTVQGDMIDSICHRFYGRTDGTVEAVLEANPDLRDAAPVLPVGTIVILPDVTAQEPRRIRLYD